MLRRQAAEIPDGHYEAELGFLDDDGKNYATKLLVKVSVMTDPNTMITDQKRTRELRRGCTNTRADSPVPTTG